MGVRATSVSQADGRRKAVPVGEDWGMVRDTRGDVMGVVVLPVPLRVPSAHLGGVFSTDGVAGKGGRVRRMENVRLEGDCKPRPSIGSTVKLNKVEYTGGVRVGRARVRSNPVEVRLNAALKARREGWAARSV